MAHEMLLQIPSALTLIMLVKVNLWGLDNMGILSSSPGTRWNSGNKGDIFIKHMEAIPKFVEEF